MNGYRTWFRGGGTGRDNENSVESFLRRTSLVEIAQIFPVISQDFLVDQHGSLSRDLGGRGFSGNDAVDDVRPTGSSALEFFLVTA